MQRHLFLLLFALAISGCRSVPPENAQFRSVEAIEEFVGTYRNKGEGAKDSNPRYLSQILWPELIKFSHPSIETIRIEMANDTTLLAKAISNGEVQLERTLIAGKDFSLKGGRISINSKISFAGFGGEPVLGPYYEKASVGLDENGQGKYQSNAGTLGLAFGIIPIAFATTEDIRFEKVENP